MKIKLTNPIAKAAVLLLTFAVFSGGLRASTLIEDTFTRSGNLNASSPDTGPAWNGSPWTSNGSELNISGSNASLISGLTFEPNTVYALSMDVSVASGGAGGGDDWIGFGFTEAGGNAALNSQGFMLHKFNPLVELFSNGLSGKQILDSLSPFPNTMEIELTTGNTLTNSTLIYRLNGAVVGSSATTDASSLNSVFVQNIGGAVGTVDNFLLTAVAVPTPDSFPGTSIEFVDIGEPGNVADDTGYGAVEYAYRISKHEVSEAMIDAYHADNGGPTISKITWSPNGPVRGINWNEAARFVNWLNTSQGFDVAYKFTTGGTNDDIELWTNGDPGYDATNPFRNSNALYFLPSENEWYKAAYYDGTTGIYYDFATGSDSVPIYVDSGTDPGTVVHGPGQPAATTNAGGLSPYGTMAQTGNVWELMESAYTPPNDSGIKSRIVRGGSWYTQLNNFDSSYRGQTGTNGQGTQHIGFRVASKPLFPKISVQDSESTPLTSGSSSVDFGGGPVGSYSESETFTFCNTGMMPLEVSSVTVTGGAAADYSLAGNVGPTTLAPGQCQTFTVTFSPSATGFRPTSLLINSNDSDQTPFSIGLTGLGAEASSTGFTQDAYIKASDTAPSDQFGHAVAISNNTLVVGAREEKSLAQTISHSQTGNPTGPEAFDVGAAYVYILNAQSQWELQATLKASNSAEGHQFGRSLDIEGDTLVVGTFSQSAFVFVRNNGTWTEQDILQRTNSEGSGRFGYSVSISGETIVVGADADALVSPPGLVGGAAYVFTRSGTTWSQQQYLKASDAMAGDRFGQAVAISGDTIVVGAASEGQTGLERSGAVYIFERNSSNNWAETVKIKAFNAAQDQAFGEAVDIDRNTLVVGAPSTFGSVGSAYAYVQDGTGGWSLEGHFPSSEVYFGESVAVKRNRILVGSTGDFSESGSTYLFERTNGNWTQQSCLRASNPESGDNFGVGVAISDCLIAVGASGEDSNAVLVNGDQSNNAASGSGAAYVFSDSNGATSLSYEEAVAAAGLTGVNALPSSIPFGDGVPNLLKFAFNMNLSGPDLHWMAIGANSGLPCGEIVEEAGQKYWRFEYVERKGCAIFYTPLKSHGLQPTSFLPLGQIRTESSIDGTWKRVTLWEPYDPTNQPKSFYRVEVELP